MRRFERRAVALLTGGDPDPERRATIEAYVDETLRLMPDHLRYGVALESFVLGTAGSAAHAAGLLDDERLRRVLTRLESSTITPLRQYVRLLRSLALYAAEELDEAAGARA